MTDDLTALGSLYPAWYTRRPANAPYVIATRDDRTHLTDAELRAGLSMTLIEDTPEALSEALATQLTIERTL
ncbi:MAG: hypothetical protein ABIS86_08185 [Streptosporangiaceae bacterium]